jgi:hypothetical protein
MDMTETQRVETIIACLYRTISGPAGQAPDWDTERQLLHPTARLMRTGIDDDGRPWCKSMSIEDYIADTASFLESTDFFEIEVAREVQRFGNVASVRSVYEARAHPEDAEPIKRGVNFIHLYHDGSRWWIMNIIWDNEHDDLVVPNAWLAD